MFESEHLIAHVTSLEADNARLRGGIQDYLDGDFGRDKHFKTKHDKCPHELFGWEACENCIDDYFKQLLQEQAR